MNSAALAGIIRALLVAAPYDEALLGSEGLKSLASEIEKLPEFQRLHGTMLQAARGAMGFDSNLLALYVVKLARGIGVDGAITGLAGFLAQEYREGHVVMLISSMTVTSSVELGNDVRIVPVESLNSDTLAMYYTMVQMVKGLKIEKPSAALVMRHAVRPAFANELSGLDAFQEALMTLEDARRCFCFFGPSTPVTIAYWWEPSADPLPLGWGMSWSAPSVELVGHEHSHRITDQEVDKYRAHWRAFADLRISDKRVLRVALDRLSRGLRRHSSVDAAIELGVAMEAFFLSDLDPTELAYRLQLRCAWWLGTSKETRRELIQWAGVAYKCRSLAVHRGYLAEKLEEGWAKGFRGMETRKFIRSACTRVLEAIALALERGMPDWSSLVLGPD